MILRLRPQSVMAIKPGSAWPDAAVQLTNDPGVCFSPGWTEVRTQSR